MQSDEGVYAEQIQRGKRLIDILHGSGNPTAEDVRKKRADQIRVVRQMLKDLEHALGHFPAIEDVWMEFNFRVNQGESVDKEELIKQYLSRTRARLAKSLMASETLATLCRSYVPPQQ